MPEDRTQEVTAAIGVRVRELRLLREWSQEKLAERAGITVEMVSRAENARMVPSLGTLLSLADGLGLGLPELLDPDCPRPTEGVNDQEYELLMAWRKLSSEGREHLLAFLQDSTARK